MIKAIKRMFIFSLVVCLFIGVTNMVVHAESDYCKKINIYIFNHRSQTIKVTKVMYFDYAVNRWRNESTWATLKLAPGDKHCRHRTLEHVKEGYPTMVKIYYKVKTGFMRWSGVILMQSQRFTCRNYHLVNFVIKEKLTKGGE